MREPYMAKVYWVRLDPEAFPDHPSVPGDIRDGPLR